MMHQICEASAHGRGKIGFFQDTSHVMTLLRSHDEEGKQEELAGLAPYWTWSPGILSVCEDAESWFSCPAPASHSLETVLV